MKKIMMESQPRNHPFFVSSTLSRIREDDDDGGGRVDNYGSKIGVDLSSSGGQECESVFRKFKYFAIIGCLTGSFPVQNCFRGKSSNQLVFRKCSFIYLYSWFLLPVKFFMLIMGTICFFRLYWLDFKSHTNVDRAALATVYILTFCFGIIAHILNINRSGRLLKLFQQLDTYDDKYPCPFPTRVLSKKVVTCLFANWLVIVFPLVTTLNAFARKINRPDKLVLFYGLGSTSNLALILVISTIGMWFIEFATAFYYIVLYYMAAVLTHRLKNIVKNVQDKSVSTKKMMGHLFLDEEEIGGGKSMNKKKMMQSREGELDFNWKFSCYRSKKSWTLISQQYLDYSDVLGQFCEFSGSAFMILYLSLMMTLVCMLFYYFSVPGPGSDFASECGPTLIGIVIFGFYRILHLSDIGENLEKTHALLLESLLRVQQEQDVHFLSEEKNQFKGLKTLVRTIPIVISAKGFFTVNRTNVTSILSVIITYIIVLVQFRMSTEAVGTSGTSETTNRSNTEPPTNLTA